MLALTADANPCNVVDTSYAWVRPDGTIEPLDGQTHVQYAWTRSHPSEKWVEHRHFKEGQVLTDALLADGWVRVTNSYTLEFESSHVTSRAMDTVATLLIGCSTRSSKNIENQIVWVEAGQGTEQLPVPDFLEKYGTRRHVDALFDALERRAASWQHRMAKRVASRLLG